jgi:hypothetical protein
MSGIFRWHILPLVLGALRLADGLMEVHGYGRRLELKKIHVS